MLNRQQNDVHVLASRLQRQQINCLMAKAALAHEKRSFFQRPIALILPFGAGAIATMLVTRRPPVKVQNSQSGLLPITTLISAASAFWSATRSLRRELGLNSAELLRTLQPKRRSEGLQGPNEH